MNVDLPYEIGTILKTTEGGKVHHDKLHHYIVGEKIQAVLMLNYETKPRFSGPIDIDDLKKRWKVVEK